MNTFTVLLVGLLVIFYLNFLGRRRATRARAAMVQRLVAGAEVVTTSGLHGTVVEIPEDGTVLLQTAPGQVSRWEKLAVARVESSPADAANEMSPDELSAAEEPPVEASGVREADEPARPGGTAPDGSPAHPPVEPARESLPDTSPPDRA